MMNFNSEENCQINGNHPIKILLRNKQNGLDTQCKKLETAFKEHQDNIQFWLIWDEFMRNNMRLILDNPQQSIKNKSIQQMWRFGVKMVNDQYLKKISNKSDKNRYVKTNYNRFLECCKGIYVWIILQTTHCRLKNITSVPLRRLRTKRHLKKQLNIHERALSMIVHNSYICIGDLNRYKKDMKSALDSYNRAISEMPHLGHPYNQIGIVYEYFNVNTGENMLHVLYHYVRAISSTISFPLAKSNLARITKSLSNIREQSDSNGDVSLMYFCHVFSCIYNKCNDNVIYNGTRQLLKHLPNTLRNERIVNYPTSLQMSALCMFLFCQTNSDLLYCLLLRLVTNDLSSHLFPAIYSLLSFIGCNLQTDLTIPTRLLVEFYNCLKKLEPIIILDIDSNCVNLSRLYEEDFLNEFEVAGRNTVIFDSFSTSENYSNERHTRAFRLKRLIQQYELNVLEIIECRKQLQVDENTMLNIN